MRCSSSLIFWVDSCGVPGDVVAGCDCGCDEAGVGCSTSCDCTPLDCETLGKECGTWMDGCGGQNICGDCRGGNECSADGQCTGDCVPMACSEMGYECGTWDDGCGSAVSCGSCSDGAECNTAGRCVVPCTPKTCTELGFECGKWDNGCGSDVNCGTCSDGNVCGNDGRCATSCVPKTCGDLGVECGTWDDECGGQTICEPCPSNSGCTAEGHCSTQCTPKTCADLGYECGAWDDQCGGIATCASCTGKAVCTATGKCETPCSPKSCSALGAECGAPDDECGTTLDCGGCSEDSECSDQFLCELLCPGVSISVDGVLDLNIRMVKISGNVLLEGSALPNSTKSRGSLVFVDKNGAGNAVVDLGTTGSLSYALSLAPGEYQIFYTPNGAACETSSSRAMPCAGGILKESISISQNGVLDIDIPVVRVRGNVTVGGASMPTSTADRGSILFAGTGGSGTTKTFGLSGAASYEMRVIPGTYNVQYTANPAQCTGRNTPSVPCISGNLRTGLTVNDDGTLDLNLTVVRVQGNVTLAGGTMPTASGERGHVMFTLRNGGAVAARNLGSSGATDFALSLLPGTYDISWSGNALCDGKSFAPVPCNGGLLQSGIQINNDGALSVDVGIVKVSGAVTVNGQAMPGSSASRGSIAFATPSGYVVPGDFGTTGAASYKVSILPGDYWVFWMGNGLCTNGTSLSIPCNVGPIKINIPLTSNGVLDLNLPLVKVEGKVTVKGLTMPSATSARGSLIFTIADGSALATESFGTSGAATYSIALLAGKYDVSWSGNSLCDGRTAPGIPCNAGLLRTAVTLTSSGVLDINLNPLKAQGSAKLNGGSLPSATKSRGSFTFSKVDGGAVSTADLGISGAFQYALTLLGGTYIVRHNANAALCGKGIAAPAVPCSGSVVVGCTD